MAGRQAQLAAEFLVQLRTVAPLPLERAGVLLRAVASRIGEAVVVGNAYGPGTPVDTGNARGHWYVSMGEAAPPRDANADHPMTGGQGAGTLALAAIMGRTAQAKIGDVINFVNDVPYIEVLNNGHSRQAPGGMTDPVVAAFEVIVQQEAARLNIGVR